MKIANHYAISPQSMNHNHFVTHSLLYPHPPIAPCVKCIIYLVKLDIGLIELLGEREDGALGVGSNDYARGAELLHLPADAGDGAPGAGADHHHVHGSVEGVQDLGGRAVVVSQRITGTAVLKENLKNHLS